MYMSSRYRVYATLTESVTSSNHHGPPYLYIKEFDITHLEIPSRLGLLNLLGLRERPLTLLRLGDREFLLPRGGLLLGGLLDFDLFRGLLERCLLPGLPDFDLLRGLLDLLRGLCDLDLLRALRDLDFLREIGDFDFRGLCDLDRLRGLLDFDFLGDLDLLDSLRGLRDFDLLRETGDFDLLWGLGDLDFLRKLGEFDLHSEIFKIYA